MGAADPLVRTRARYGQDAPPVLLRLFSIGGLLLALGLVGRFWLRGERDADARSLPFGACAFDLVVSSFAVHKC